MESKFLLDVKGEVAKIELLGRLDAANAPLLQEELKKLAGSAINRVVFYAKALEYISSAGLRVIIFAKQKMSTNAQVYFIGAQELVLGTIKMSGLDNFMFLQDTYND